MGEKKEMNYIPVVSAVITFLNVIIAVVAIVTNNRLAKNREIRKENRSKYDSLQKRIEEVENLGIGFHTSELYNPLLSDEIRWKIDRTSKIMNTTAELKRDAVIVAFTDYKKSLTANNFGKSRFITQQANSDLIRDIHHSTSLLISEIEKTFYSVNK